jgi:hypothetical protein
LLTKTFQFNGTAQAFVESTKSEIIASGFARAEVNYSGPPNCGKIKLTAENQKQLDAAVKLITRDPLRSKHFRES